MAEYQITVRQSNPDGPRRVVTYDLTTDYTIDEDIGEWLREEIDPNVKVTEADECRNCGTVVNSAQAPCCALFGKGLGPITP